MAIALQGTPGLYENASSTSAVVPYPAGITAGEVLTLHVVNSGATVPTTPSGWTLAKAQANTSATSQAVFYKVATGSESGTQAVASGVAAGRLTGIMIRWSGVDTTTPIDVAGVSATTGTASSITTPTLTTVNNGAMLVYTLGVNSSGSADVDAAAGTTKVQTTTGTGRRTSIFTEVDATAGATGTRVWNLNPTTPTLQMTGSTIALRPGASGPATPVLVRAAGGIPTTTSMAIAVNTTSATSVRIKAGTNSGLTTGVVWGGAVTPNGDGNSQLTVTGLTPNTAYFYRIAMTDTGAVESLDTWTTVGQFKTDLDGALAFSFAFGSCTNSTDSASMAAIAVKKPDLFFHLGDEYYADASGNTVANFRDKVGAKMTAPNHAAVYRTSGSSWVPSDHDAANNNGNYAADPTGWTNWNQVFREMKPDTGLPGSMGVYRTFKRGRIRFIALDRRSFASAAANTDNSSKTSLGATQKTWFKNLIDTSTEPVIVVQNADPWIITASAGDDGWGGYITERDELAAYIAASGKNVVMLAGDMHALAAEDGSGSPGGVPVFQAAPLYQNASIKGGPYDVGPYPASGTAVVQQYGWMDVTDSGTSISLIFKGFSSDNTQRVTLTKTYAVSVAYSGTLALSAAGTQTRAMGGGTEGPGGAQFYTFPGDPPQLDADLDNVSVNLGTEFYVTAPAWATEVSFLQPTGAISMASREATIWSTTNGISNTLVAGPYTIPAPAAGSWGSLTLPSPVALTPGTRYRIVIRHPEGKYAATPGYFSTGPGASTLTQGLLVRPNSNDAYGNDQGSYEYNAGNAFPLGSFGAASYYSDITVFESVGGGAGLALSGNLALGATGTMSRSAVTTASGTLALSGSGALAPVAKGLTVPAPDWSEAKRLTTIGQGAARILTIGDSTTLGFGGSTPDNSYPYELRDLFGANAETGMVIPSNTPSVTDSRWNVGTGVQANGDWAISGGFGWGNKSSYRAASSPATVNDLVFTPGYTFDVVDFYYITSPTNATIPVHVGGVEVGTLVAGSGKAAGWEKATITVPAGSTAVTLKPSGGNFWIGGIHARTAGRSKINVSAAGSSGSLTNDWIAGSYDSRKAIAAFAPDLTIISLGINDSSNAVAVATYKANMQALITQAQVTGDVIVVTVPPSLDNGAGRASLQQQYRTAVYELAGTMGFSIVDITAKWGTFEAANAAGWMSDNVHPTALGYDVMAASIYDTVNAVTAFASTVYLGASGTLTRSGTPRPAAALARTATGTMGRAATVSFATAAPPEATATLTLSPGAITGLTGACALTGAGTLTYARGLMGGVGSRALSALGALALAGGKNATGNVTLSGAGALALSGAPGVARPLALSATGAMALTTTSEFAGSVALSGTGTLTGASAGMSGTSVLDRNAAGTLSRAVAAVHAVQTGNLSATGTLIRSSFASTMSSSCALSAATSLVLTSANSFSGLLTLTATGALSGAGTPGPRFTATPNGVGALSLLAATTVQYGTCELDGSGSLSAAIAGMSGTGTVARTATGTLTLTGATPRPAATLARTGAGTLAGVAGLLTQSATLARSIIGILYLSASGNGSGGISLSGTGTLNTAANDPGLKQTLGRTATGSLAAVISGQTVAQSLGTSASGSLTFTGKVFGTCQLGGAGALTLAGAPGHTGATALSGAGTLALAGGVNSDLVLYATGSLSLTAGAMAQSGTAALTGSGGLVLSSLLSPAMVLNLSATGDLSPDDGFAGVLGSLARSGSGGLTSATQAMGVLRVLALVGAGTMDLRFLPQDAVGVLLLSASCQLGLDWIPGRARTRIMPPKYHAVIKARRSLNQ